MGSPKVIKYVTCRKILASNRSKCSQIFASSDSSMARIQRFPNTFERMVSATIYIIPSLDSAAVTLSLLKWWASLSWAWFLIEPITVLYYTSSFTPLIIFLAVVRNKNFHHIVRFHAMQAVMLDIVIML